MPVIRRADRLRSALAALPLDDPTALVADAASCSDALFELEQRFVQPAGAHIVAVAAQLAAPGDFVTTTIGTDALVAVHGRDGVLRALSNVCTHRASLLLEGEGNCGRTMTCPYHGWIFGLDGRLLGVPYRTGFDDVPQDDLGLASWPIAKLGGLVVVDPRRSIDGPAIQVDVTATFADVEWGHDGSAEVDVDWKALMMATLVDEAEAVVATVFPACAVIVCGGRLVAQRCEPLAPHRTRVHRYAADLPADGAPSGNGDPSVAREWWASRYAAALAQLTTR